MQRPTILPSADQRSSITTANAWTFAQSFVDDCDVLTHSGSLGKGLAASDLDSWLQRLVTVQESCSAMRSGPLTDVDSSAVDRQSLARRLVEVRERLRVQWHFRNVWRQVAAVILAEDPQQRIYNARGVRVMSET